MWKCPKCGEQHESQFGICWNCGTSSDGVRDASIDFAETVDDQGEAAADSGEFTSLGDFQLPTITYYGIPPYLWLSCRVERGRCPLAESSCVQFLSFFCL